MDLFFFEATSTKTARTGRPSSRSSFLRAIHRDSAFKDDWHVMGMRATASRSSELKDAFVPECRRGSAAPGLEERTHHEGVRQGAIHDRRAVYRDRRRRRAISQSSSCGSGTRFPLKNPMSHLPSVYNKVGEMDLLIEGARAAMWKAAAEMDADDPASWSRKAVAARMIAVENSVRVVDLALRAVGGSSYFKRLPLERLFRDVRAGLYHPFRQRRDAGISRQERIWNSTLRRPRPDLTHRAEIRTFVFSMLQASRCGCLILGAQ